VAHLLALLNMSRALADRTAIGDLSTPVTATQVAFAPGLLAAQVFVQLTASGLVGINMQVHAFVADLELAGNLLGAPLHAQVKVHLGPYLGVHTSGVAAVLGTLRCFAASLLGAVATPATATLKFAADGAAVAAQQAGNLGERVLGFQEAVNLVSFFSAEVLVHRATWTWRFKRP